MARGKQNQNQEDPQEEAKQAPEQEQQQDGSEQVAPENVGQDESYAEKLQADALKEHEATKKDNIDPMLESVNYEKNKGAEEGGE